MITLAERLIGVQKLFFWRSHQGVLVCFLSPDGVRLCGEKTPFSPSPPPCYDLLWLVIMSFLIIALEAQGFLQFPGCPVYYTAVSGSQPVTCCLVRRDSFFRIIRLQVLGKSCKMDTYNLKPDPQTPMGCLL